MKRLMKSASFFVVTLICFGVLSSVYFKIAKVSMSSFNGYTIVVDAGHGGRDGGSIGANGTIEKEINLRYAKELKNKLIQMGFKVEMTRKNDDGLYSEFASNKKISDLNKRIEIIKKAKPNLLISIHMNSFPTTTAKGATTYYRNKDEEGMHVADLIQKSIKNNCGARWENGKVGDYYILNETYYTAVLIECGFISNPEEEKLLNTDDYIKRFTKDTLLTSL